MRSQQALAIRRKRVGIEPRAVTGIHRTQVTGLQFMEPVIAATHLIRVQQQPLPRGRADEVVDPEPFAGAGEPFAGAWHKELLTSDHRAVAAGGFVAGNLRPGRAVGRLQLQIA
ncbi:MAG: hypothetical protein O3C21_13270 [Verrucomicrobia bacterium]|nr:hypothetical protein [Verrucomicrobiota bacterium]